MKVYFEASVTVKEDKRYWSMSIKEKDKYWAGLKKKFISGKLQRHIIECGIVGVEEEKR
jgi:hypothetical protein